jgi:hypothetical protein
LKEKKRKKKEQRRGVGRFIYTHIGENKTFIRGILAKS